MGFHHQLTHIHLNKIPTASGALVQIAPISEHNDDSGLILAMRPMQDNNDPINGLFEHWLEAFSMRIGTFNFRKSLNRAKKLALV